MHLKNRVILMAGLLLLPITAKAASLRGSKESLDKQYRMARELRLPRIQNVAQINQLLMNGQLYELPRQGETFYLDEQIGEYDPMYAHMYRVASPVAIKFISQWSRKFYNQFDGKRLKVTSLVRTVEYQKKLQRRNANATAVSRSAHLTGSAIDISYKELVADEIKWMRTELLALEKKQMIEATEERFQACFHVMVFRE